VRDEETFMLLPFPHSVTELIQSGKVSITNMNPPLARTNHKDRNEGIAGVCPYIAEKALHLKFLY
jgi:hypothetical protein